LTNAWQESLQAAKDLQEGKEVGRIGFYAPDIVIKGNMIDSITDPDFSTENRSEPSAKLSSPFLKQQKERRLAL
jgi:hypothetical protein